MEHLSTDRDGRLTLAAISRTTLATKGARLVELQRFYARLPAFGVTHVFHLGAVNRVIPQPFGPSVDLAAAWPQVPGVTTVQLRGDPADPARACSHYAARMAAGGRTDWDTCPNRIPITHGLSGAPVGHLALCFDVSARALKGVVKTCGCSAATDLIAPELPEIVLVGGRREPDARQLSGTRGFIASIGVFEARRRFKNPPDPFGGTIIDAVFGEDGELVECAATFRDMSGGEVDVKRRVTG